MLPPLPRFFADAAWCHMAAFLQKKLGERAGERGRFSALLVRPPSSGLSGTFSPEGEKGFRSPGEH